MEYKIFSQLQNMSREDEMRSRILIRGVKQILEKKKEESLLKKIFRKKNKIEPKAWE